MDAVFRWHIEKVSAVKVTFLSRWGGSVVCVETESTVEQFFVWLLHNTKKHCSSIIDNLLIILLNWDYDMRGDKKRLQNEEALGGCVTGSK